MTSIDKTKELLIKYSKRECTPEEEALIESWFLNWKDEKPGPDAKELNRIKQEIWKTLPVQNTLRIKIFSKLNLITAAAVLIVTGIGVFLFNLKEQGNTKTPETYTVDILPKKNKALLTLANGSVISLTDAASGNIINQSGTNIVKHANGAIIYSKGDEASYKKPEYNIIKIPNGGPYRIQLSDGTSVWLNSASSLKFPVSFQSLKERTVELEGEGYFEVAKAKNRPFKVITHQQEIEVLGTHFNVNSYLDEPDVKTTLLEGSIRLTFKNRKDQLKEMLLQPGQQSAVGASAIIVPADVESAMAWRAGNFIFKNQELSLTMRQIERWYDVEVVYAPDAPKTLKIGGSVAKDNPISKILSAMEITGKVKFKIEGRRITVSKP